MLPSNELRSAARKALIGRWPAAIAVYIIALITGVYGLSSDLLRLNNPYDRAYLSFLMGQSGSIILRVFGAVITFLICLTFVQLVLAGATRLGVCAFHIRLFIDEESPKTSQVFAYYDNIIKGFCLHFLTGLFIALWSLLLIVPGIIASYRYAMAPYIMAENPELGIMEALSLSSNLMDGKKMNLFCLELTFIGWFLLSVVTLRIASFYTAPYYQAAYAAFYLDANGRLPESTS